MSLRRAVGTPARPADPRTIPAATARVLEDAVRVTGCSTPVIGLNELFEAQRPAPWRPRTARYRANVLALVQGLAAHGAQPQLFISQAGATGGAAGNWWRAVAQAATIVRELYLPAPWLHAFGPGRASVYMRFELRRAVRNLTTIGVPSSRVGIALGFQAGRGGRMGLAAAPWFEVVKREALATRQVAGELGLGLRVVVGLGHLPGRSCRPGHEASGLRLSLDPGSRPLRRACRGGLRLQPFPRPTCRGRPPARDAPGAELPPPSLVPGGRVGQAGGAHRVPAGTARWRVAQPAAAAPRPAAPAADARAALERTPPRPAVRRGGERTAGRGVLRPRPASYASTEARLALGSLEPSATTRRSKDGHRATGLCNLGRRPAQRVGDSSTSAAARSAARR